MCDFQPEAESGLNVVENLNGLNDYIRFGKRDEPASNRREEHARDVMQARVLVMQAQAHRQHGVSR